MRKVKKEEVPVSLLKALCGDDEQLYDCLANHLYENPLTAFSGEDLDTLIAEADKSGKYGVAVDKAIFDAAQNPADAEKYVAVILNLVSKGIAEIEKENDEADKLGSGGMSTSFEIKLAHQKLLRERTKEVISIAARFYEEKLSDLGATTRREEREKERQSAERENVRIDDREKTEQEARQKERRGMRRRERKEAKKRDRIEELAAKERKETREETRKSAELENTKINEEEKAARGVRKKEFEK